MGKQYLTFTLADTIYAVNVFQVREVLPYVPPQTLPNPDPVIEGLIRSRDQSISVINLRRRFGLEDRKPDKSTRIIVLEIHSDEDGEENVFGAIADGVNEVLDLEKIGCELTPELGNSPAADFIQGIGRQDDKFIIILDVDKIFSFSEISMMEDAASRFENGAQDIDSEKDSVSGEETADNMPDSDGMASAGNPEAAGNEATAGNVVYTDNADKVDDPDYLDSDPEEFEEL